MRFLAFPVAGLGFLILWGAGLSTGAALVLGPALGLFLMAVFLPLLWPAPPGKKRGRAIRIHPHDDRPRRPRGTDTRNP